MFWQPRQGLIAGRGALNPASTPLPVTWDSATITAVTLSGGDLVATNTGTSAVNQGAHVNFSPGKTSGKWYVEIAFTTITSGSGSNLGVGLGTTTSNYSQMGASALTGNMCYQSGNLWANNASTGVSLGARSSGDVIAIAIDLDNRKIWFKKVNATAGNWNNNGSADPATNVGGQTIPAGTMVPFCTFGGTSGAINNVTTLNAGATAFTGSVPSGFTSGWTA
jgi:hypothetical protein